MLHNQPRKSFHSKVIFHWESLNPVWKGNKVKSIVKFGYHEKFFFLLVKERARKIEKWERTKGKSSVKAFEGCGMNAFCLFPKFCKKIWVSSFLKQSLTRLLMLFFLNCQKTITIPPPETASLVENTKVPLSTFFVLLSLRWDFLWAKCSPMKLQFANVVHFSRMCWSFCRLFSNENREIEK